MAETQQNNMVQWPLRMSPNVIQYLEKTHGKNARHFVRVAVDVAIAKEKQGKG